MTFSAMIHRVRDDLGQAHRYAHCIRVARLAERLAYAHGVDTRQARIAGILHDLARLYSAQRLLDEAAARRLPMADFERAHPVLLHARLSAALARERFGIEDAAILDAIAKHTLADARMSQLDCVIYLADSLEPGRSFAQRPQLEAMAFADLNAGMRETLRASMEWLAERGIPLAPPTAQAARRYGIALEDVSPV